MKNLEFRWDILLSLAIPYISGIVVTILITGFTLDILFIIASLVIIGGLILECATINEKTINNSTDRGIVSGVIVSSIIMLVAISALFETPLNVTNEFVLFAYLLGLVLFTLGITIRLKAKRDLKGHFSHSLQITPQHKLITSGIYKYMRHPAYTGTFLMLLGASLLYGTYVGLLLIILASPFGIMRIINEERMLNQEFGNEYLSYSKKVKKLIPFIY